MTLDELKRELWKDPEFRRTWRRRWSIHLRNWIAIKIMHLSGFLNRFADWLICWGTNDCDDDDWEPDDDDYDCEAAEEAVINYYLGLDIPGEWRGLVEVRE